jgi:hypothetical protein
MSKNGSKMVSQNRQKEVRKWIKNDVQNRPKYVQKLIKNGVPKSPKQRSENKSKNDVSKSSKRCPKMDQK